MTKGLVCLGAVALCVAAGWAANAAELDRSTGSVRTAHTTAEQVAQKDAPYLSYARQMPTSKTPSTAPRPLPRPPTTAATKPLSPSMMPTS